MYVHINAWKHVHMLECMQGGIGCQPLQKCTAADVLLVVVCMCRDIY
jgi:hypothetical protein